MKSLLIYTLWFGSQIEYRGHTTTCSADWVRIECGRFYGVGRTYIREFDGKKKVILDRDVARWLINQNDRDKQLKCILYKTPKGYVYVLDKRLPQHTMPPVFWLDEFDARKDK